MNPLSEAAIKRGREQCSRLAAALHLQQSCPVQVPRLPGPLATPDQLAADLVASLIPATRQLNPDELIIGMGEVLRPLDDAAAREAGVASLAEVLGLALSTAGPAVQVEALERAMLAIHDRPTAARLLYRAADRVFSEGV